MPKLPAITSKRLVKLFEKIGFQIDHCSGSHFVLYNEISKKRITIPSHSKDLPKGTLMSILREAGIGRDDFLKMF